MEKNKPCPFCGSDNIAVYMQYTGSAGLKYGGYYPECVACGCRLISYKSQKEAIEAWNRRTDDGRE